MPYISGLNNKDGRLIIINEADWSVEVNKETTASPEDGYEETVDAGTKLVVFRRTSGEIEAYGNVTPSETSIYPPPEPEYDWTSYLGPYEVLGIPCMYWEPNPDFEYGTWDSGNEEWDSEVNSGNSHYLLSLKAMSEPTPWVSGFRPTRIRISFTDGNVPDYTSLRFMDSNYNALVDVGGDGRVDITEDKQVVDITFGSRNLTYIVLEAGEEGSPGDSFSVSDIEFTEDE